MITPTRRPTVDAPQIRQLKPRKISVASAVRTMNNPVVT